MIKKGTVVIIPTHAIHHDPRYFPDPEKFNPERFTPESKASRNPYTFMPFGHGLRNCIVIRITEFTKLQIRIYYKIGKTN